MQTTPNEPPDPPAAGSTDGARNNIRAALLALAAFGLFATHDVIIKTLGATYSPFQIVFFGVLFSFPLATFYLMGDRTSDNLIPHHPGWLALRTLAAVLTGVSAFYAFSVLPMAQVYAIIFATPILITVLSIPLLGETVKMHRWLAILAGLAGVAITLRPTTLQIELGHLAALVAAFCGALASVIVRKIGPDERPVVLILYPMAANFLLMACLLPFTYQPVPLADLGASAAAACLGFAAMLLIIAAYRKGSPQIVAPMQYSQILWAALYGALFFGEMLDLYTTIGAAIIIMSGLYIVFRESYGGNSVQTPVLRTRPRLETGTVLVTRAGQSLRVDRSRLTDQPDRPQPR